MKSMLCATLYALLLAGATPIDGFAQAGGPARDVIASAVADPARPQDDRNRDVARRPAESLQFSEVKPGEAVADFNANAGYFTRLFADVVGSGGHVYAIEPTEIQKYAAKATAELQTYATTHPNVTVSVSSGLDSVRNLAPLDIFWISQNYHDLHNDYFGPMDMAAFNKAVFHALKRGGLYVVLDHRAAAGAPANVTQTLHRIEPTTVRRELEAAGFRFEGESSILANPVDPHTIEVFDKSVRGHTDQFLLKFRKPG